MAMMRSAQRTLWTVLWTTLAAVLVGVEANGLASIVEEVGSLRHEAVVAWDGQVLEEPSVENELVAWANTQSFIPEDRQSYRGVERAFLLIGVKTSVLHAFPARQAIRETWAEVAWLAQHDVKVLFLGCEPDLSGYDVTQQRKLQDAIALEKVRYGDLLTDELHCRDSYALLLDKVVAFFHYAATRWRFAFAMVTDDDIYLRVDRMVEILEQQNTTGRFYAGNVCSVQNRAPLLPQRDPTEKNYVPHEVYPMTELPPFALGPHYLLSADLVHYISRNRRDLRGFGSVEDVFVGLWLLALQVHPVHLPQFQDLRYALCSVDLVSLASLSPAAIRRVQDNLNQGLSFCAGSTHTGWLKQVSEANLPASSQSKAEWEALEYQWDIAYHHSTRDLELLINFTRPGNESVLQLSYISAYVSFFDLCREIHDQTHAALIPANAPDSQFCHRFRGFLLQIVNEAIINSPTTRPHFSQLLHNLQSRIPDFGFVIGYSLSATYPKVVFQSLFSSIFPHAQLVFFPEVLLDNELKRPPHVFIFSVLDGGCNMGWTQECERTVTMYTNKYPLSKLVMISGEAEDIAEYLPPQIVLVSTIQHVERPGHVYLSHVSASFGERVKHSPEDLLQPSLPTADSASRHFCAYLYANCNRPQREYMYDLLNEFEPVDALGVCQGALKEPNRTRLVGRASEFYNDDAVVIFSEYKFVIAFENARVPGYLTEKIVNALLAGSVPVYFGHSTTVAQLFNPESFIDCGNFPLLRDCAAYVLQVHRSDELYAAYRRAPPIVNRTAFRQHFSWHPAVDNAMMADQLRELFNRV
ncbi:hypothetical protein Poli38472_013868 [Pythium oligandrum]|uniref:Fucosyltransferase n=1 Tax=Pythium oligandrum TaxID=41045 RepID=A0A8K1C283_PYTOL|nr:hypothetical protein Poli38472_013868 [Pythium oligandrum]|eukprot:TMW55106.1 hypothetical protein Poli38472_013868 [Pythium oligandrum]